ncbi:MAG TPA: phosphate ABC transporter substrate-binding protein [Chromatiales bacterium]|nr:phosphate ABC transporter substrate-binding protein [Chromatiales bacterium]
MIRQIFRRCRIALALAGLAALFAGTAWANAGAPVVQVTDTAHREGGLLWVGCGISKKSYMIAAAKAFTEKTGIKIKVEGGGATRGIRDVADSKADFGGSCRFIIPGIASEMGDVLKPVAWDALVVIADKSNPVKNVTLDQVRGVYLGKITNWKQLGGPDKPIHLFVRRGKISGVGRTIRKLVFGNYDQDFVATKAFRSSGPLEKAVEKDPDAIAITGISSARKRNVDILALNGKRPTYDNIRNGRYVLYRPLYLVINPDSPKIAEVNRFVQFIYSPEGRRVIRQNGVVPYMDALQLVMKQVAQDQQARAMGLYRR